jgi:hypothetical protein
MSQLLDNLSQDVFPPAMVDHFVRWCIWEQARPALVSVLTLTGVTDLADEINAASSYTELERLSEQAGNHAHEIGQRTGPLGISTAEATAFLVQKLAHVAQEADWDPEAVSFYTIQVMGWQGFAQSSFTEMRKKIEVTEAARITQEEKLAELWQPYQSDD